MVRVFVGSFNSSPLEGRLGGGCFFRDAFEIRSRCALIFSKPLVQRYKEKKSPYGIFPNVAKYGRLKNIFSKAICKE
jgi:hypothetical protein